MAGASEAEWVDDDSEDDTLLTGEAVTLTLYPVGFALRIASGAIDFAALTVVFVFVVLGVSMAANQLGAEDAWYATLAILILVLVYIVVPIVIETVTQGRSLGKLAIGGRIVREDGGAIGFRHALVRSVIGIVEVRLTFGALAALVALFHPRSKRLGDILAGTYCLQERISARTTPIYGAPLQLQGWLAVADVARMPDSLARRIAQFLAGAADLEPGRRDLLARSLADETAAFVSPLPPVDAELFLAGVVVARRDREAEALELERRRLAVLTPALTATPHGFATEPRTPPPTVRNAGTDDPHVEPDREERG